MLSPCIAVDSTAVMLPLMATNHKLKFLRTISKEVWHHPSSGTVGVIRGMDDRREKEQRRARVSGARCLLGAGK